MEKIQQNSKGKKNKVQNLGTVVGIPLCTKKKREKEIKT